MCERRQPTGVRPAVARVVHLGRDHRAFPPAVALREPPADDRLGEPATVAVHVGGVEEVDAEVERAVHDPVAFGLLGLHAGLAAHAEVHGAEAQRADAEAGAAEQSVVHGRLVLQLDDDLGVGLLAHVARGLDAAPLDEDRLAGHDVGFEVGREALWRCRAPAPRRRGRRPGSRARSRDRAGGCCCRRPARGVISQMRTRSFSNTTRSPIGPRTRSPSGHLGLLPSPVTAVLAERYSPGVERELAAHRHRRAGHAARRAGAGPRRDRRGPLGADVRQLRRDDARRQHRRHARARRRRRSRRRPPSPTTWSAILMHHDYSEPTRAKLRPGSLVLVNTTVFEDPSTADDRAQRRRDRRHRPRGRRRQHHDRVDGDARRLRRGDRHRRRSTRSTPRSPSRCRRTARQHVGAERRRAPRRASTVAAARPARRRGTRSRGMPDDTVLTRGTVVIDVEACKGCDLCIDACPPRVLVMTAHERQQPRLPLPAAGRRLHRLQGVLADLPRLRASRSTGTTSRRIEASTGRRMPGVTHSRRATSAGARSRAPRRSPRRWSPPGAGSSPATR